MSITKEDLEDGSRCMYFFKNFPMHIVERVLLLSINILNFDVLARKLMNVKNTFSQARRDALSDILRSPAATRVLLAIWVDPYFYKRLIGRRAYMRCSPDGIYISVSSRALQAESTPEFLEIFSKYLIHFGMDIFFNSPGTRFSFRIGHGSQPIRLGYFEKDCTCNICVSSTEAVPMIFSGTGDHIVRIPPRGSQLRFEIIKCPDKPEMWCYR